MTGTTTSHRGILFGDTLPAIPKGLRGFIVANPGTGKTLFMNWLAYLAAYQGKSTLVLDGETPLMQIETNLNRYSAHYGRSWHELPIAVRILSGDFGWRNLDQENLVDFNPKFVLLESIQSMSGNTNDPNVGSLVRRSLNKVHDDSRWCLISAHTNQSSFYLTKNELEEMPIPDLARIVKGDTSIVSQGCDVAYVIKQLTSDPLRLAVIVKGRRGYFKSQTYYYELKEPDGKGYDSQMWWEAIAPVHQELDSNAVDVLNLVRTHTDNDGVLVPISAKEIMGTAVTIKQEERRGIIRLLLERGDIVEHSKFCYLPRQRRRRE